MKASVVLAPLVGIVPACASRGVARAMFYRARLPFPCPLARRPRTPSPWALSDVEEAHVLAVLHGPAYVDQGPHTVFALLLDAGRYAASVSTFYRLLRGVDQTRGRRNQRVHPAYTKPELLAQRPRELWSWDITELKGPAKLTCFHLYVILDLFSRYVVGWMLAPRVSARLGARTDFGDLQQRRDRARTTHSARRPRRLDEL